MINSTEVITEIMISNCITYLFSNCLGLCCNFPTMIHKFSVLLQYLVIIQACLSLLSLAFNIHPCLGFVNLRFKTLIRKAAIVYNVFA